LGGINPEFASLSSTTNFMQMVYSTWDLDTDTRVLRRPTNEAWINPTAKFLTSQYNTEFFLSKTLVSFECSGGVVQSITIQDNASGQKNIVRGDYYLFAIPADRLLIVLQNSPTCTSVPSLNGLSSISYDWMGGMQFYLRQDAPVTDGIALYLDTPWKLTSVSFAQWWSGYNWKEIGNGDVKGIISVVISNFTAPGVLYNKPAMKSTKDEFKNEVWAQIKRSLNRFQETLRDDMLVGYSIDTSLLFENGTVTNEEKMFYSSPNIWGQCPNAQIELRNLFLAGDYVHAATRVIPTTMEAANESARRAVNALLDVSRSSQSPVVIFPPPRNVDFKATRDADCVLYKLGRPHMLCKRAGCIP